MICDAHVHVGYFPRKGHQEPFYYSPRRVLGVLHRAGVTDFIFSSTNAIWDFSGTTMHAEALEMRRLAGKNAHAFFWVTDEYLKEDPLLDKLPDFYEGLKLHGGETPWLKMPASLDRVLSIAREKSWCIQIHTGNRGDVNENQISGYLPFCKKFSTVKFDLAHGKPFDEINQAVNEHDNIYVDCAYCTVDVVQQWLDNGAREERILFGSDIPVQQRLLDISLTSYLRSILKNFSSEKILSHNFQKFLCKK